MLAYQVVLVGEQMCGKTTLLNLLLFLTEQDGEAYKGCDRCSDHGQRVLEALTPPNSAKSQCIECLPAAARRGAHLISADEAERRSRPAFVCEERNEFLTMHEQYERLGSARCNKPYMFTT